jgi:PAS domain S-box-containing protein
MTKKETNNSKATKNKISPNEELALYKSFFDNATDAVLIIDPNSYTLVETNDYAVTLLGVSKDKLKNTYMPGFKKIYKSLTKSSKINVLSELDLNTQVMTDNSIKLEVCARLVDYKGKKLIQAVVRDIREKQSLSERLVQADKLVLLGQLLAGVAHEIRNPLAAVNLNLQMLKREIKKETEQYDYISTALQGTERISRIVELTLNFSRPAVPEIKEIDINSLIPSSIELVQTELKKKKIKIELDLNDKLPKVSADAKQMQQVLINLLKNAADSIKSIGTIKIKSYEELNITNKKDNFAVIALSDNGSGISREDLPKIFDPFFTRKSNGTGLGLPITQRILHQHNGFIDVESTPGLGTTFYIKLPIKNNIINNK